MVLKKYSKWTDLKEDLGKSSKADFPWSQNSSELSFVDQHNNTYYKKYRLWLKQEIFQKTFEILINLLNCIWTLQTPPFFILLEN